MPDLIITSVQVGVKEVNLSEGEFAKRYKAAVVYLTGWFESRIINLTKSNVNHIDNAKKNSKKAMVDMTSEGEESEVEAEVVESEEEEFEDESDVDQEKEEEEEKEEKQVEDEEEEEKEGEAVGVCDLLVSSAT